MPLFYDDGTVQIHHGDARELLAGLKADVIVTDPPYGLEFMGKEWDKPHKLWTEHPQGQKGRISGRGGMETWGRTPQYRAGPAYQAWCEEWARAAWDALPPGGWLLAFGGTRTWHRLACGIEDAGFEIRDTIAEFGPSYGPLAFMYGSGFPKSRNVSKDLDPVRCQCSAVPYGHDASAEPATEYDLSGVRVGDVSTPLPARAGEGPLLLPGLPEQGASAGGAAPVAGGDEDGAQPGLEGRGDLLQDPRQLHRGPLREGAGVGATDGESGRLHHGAPAGHGGLGGAAADQNGSGQPSRPQSGEQRPEQPGAVADERRPQAGGSWPLCPRCSKPVVPSGLGTALKPAWEPIIVARKPLAGSVAQNVLTFGTGALNIDATRIGMTDADRAEAEAKNRHADFGSPARENRVYGQDGRPRSADGNWSPSGRWPSNLALIHDPGCVPVGVRKVRSNGHHPAARGPSGDYSRQGGLHGQGGLDERYMADPDGTETITAWECVEDSCPVFLLDQQSGTLITNPGKYREDQTREQWSEDWGMRRIPGKVASQGDKGGASRFFATFQADGLSDPPGTVRQWSQDAATDAEPPSPPTELHADSAVSPAQDDTTKRSSPGYPAPSTTGTGNGSRPSDDGSTQLTLSTEPRSAHESPPTRPASSGTPASPAATPTPTDTTTTTADPLRSAGSAGDATSATTPPSEVPGGSGWPPSSRLFYTAKAGRNERVTVDGEQHPTVKPLALMRWLVRLVTPPGGTVLDPFCGSGSTLVAARMEGFRAIGVEADERWCRGSVQRLAEIPPTQGVLL